MDKIHGQKKKQRILQKTKTIQKNMDKIKFNATIFKFSPPAIF